MPEIVFAIPVLPGKEELDRNTLDEMAGSRRDEYEALLKEAGVTRQAVWHQETPDGTLAIVYIEADNPDAVQRFNSSDAPLSRWFVERMQEVHGVDVSQPGPPVSGFTTLRTSKTPAPDSTRVRGRFRPRGG